MIAEDLEKISALTRLICNVASGYAPEYDMNAIYEALQNSAWQESESASADKNISYQAFRFL